MFFRVTTPNITHKILDNIRYNREIRYSDIRSKESHLQDNCIPPPLAVKSEKPKPLMGHVALGGPCILA